jgi:hypothetical protein
MIDFVFYPVKSISYESFPVSVFQHYSLRFSHPASRRNRLWTATSPLDPSPRPGVRLSKAIELNSATAKSEHAKRTAKKPS